jgi:BirA family biotin operon repressor/biotin-[acetyl-CoA-carboxylase] ligase
MFSILLRPLFLPAEKQFVISEIAALALCDVLALWGMDAAIKWPNDVYVGDKKISGVLIEHFLSGSKLSASIVGIGLNVNQTHFRSDAPNPTSVLLETGHRRAPEEALITILDFLALRYDQALQGKVQEVEDAYCARLYRLHQWNRYVRCSDNTEFDGYITGIDLFGCLRVLLRNGREEVFAFKEIRYEW